MKRPLALVVEADADLRSVIRGVLEKGEAVVLGATTEAEARDALGSRPIDILVADSATPGVELLDLIRHANRLQSPPVFVGIASAAERERMLEWIDAGALSILPRPLDRTRLAEGVGMALRQHELLDELRRLREQLRSREGYNGLVGRSSAMERLRERVHHLSATDASVWFHGEPGTGKELAARTLHGLSRRADGPFVVVPCTGRPAIEVTLDQAAGGTLYLEDLPALDLDLQGRLEEVLGDGGPAQHARFRICSSSTGDPGVAVAEGRLLERLHRRLAGETIPLPPLRERVEDVALLARHFIQTICAINHLPPIRIVPETLQLLESYPWPENAHELRNAMEQAAILSPDGTIRPRDLPDRVRAALSRERATTAGRASATRKFREAKREVVEGFERSYLSDLMERHGGNVTAASRQAGMLRSALQRLLRKYGLKSAAFRRQARRAVGAGDRARPER